MIRREAVGRAQRKAEAAGQSNGAADDWEREFRPALGKYGFGRKRSFAQLLKFTGDEHSMTVLYHNRHTETAIPSQICTVMPRLRGFMGN